MNIKHLQYIETIARMGSINKAAEALSLKQPYLSSVLVEMEREIAVKLFTRHNWGVALTPAGQEFLKSVALVNQGYQQILDLRGVFAGEHTGHFTVANIYSYTILDLFNDFVNAHQKQRENIAYIETPPMEMLETVFRERAHVGFTIHGEIHRQQYQADLDKKGLLHRSLCEEPFYLILHKDHPLAHKKSLRTEEMLEYTFVVDKQKKAFHEDNFTPWYRSGKVSPVLFDNNRSVMYFISKNPLCFTCGQLSLNTTNPFVTLGELRYIPWEDSPYRLITGIIHLRDKKLPTLAREFCHFVEQHYLNYRSSLDY